MIGLGVAGLPYVGSDVGGYISTDGASAVDQGALLPLVGARRAVAHHAHAPRLEPMMNWRFDSDAETLAHWKRWATVHIKLYPFLLAIATEAAADGAPMVRQLALGFPDDATAWTVADEYLLGPSLLVAPVLTEGAVERSVYFPAGHWIALFGSQPAAAVDGPMTSDVAAPLGELPLYAPAGTVLALLPDGVDTLAPSVPPLVGLADVGDDREVIALAGASGSFAEAGGGLAYTLTSTGAPAATASLTWNGAPLRRARRRRWRRAAASMAPAAKRRRTSSATARSRSRTARRRWRRRAAASGRALYLHIRWQ